VYGDAGDDRISTGSGDDIVYGATGNDTIAAGDGSNLVYGEDGNDSITSGSGNDTLYGGAGNDSIGGGAGINIIWGGAAAVFNGSPVSDPAAFNSLVLGPNFQQTLIGTVDVPAPSGLQLGKTATFSLSVGGATPVPVNVTIGSNDTTPFQLVTDI